MRFVFLSLIPLSPLLAIMLLGDSPSQPVVDQEPIVREVDEQPTILCTGRGRPPDQRGQPTVLNERETQTDKQVLDLREHRSHR